MQISPQNITKLEGWQLAKAFAQLDSPNMAPIKNAVFSKLTLNQLMLILSKIQFSKKNDELADITKQLQGFTDKIAQVNQQVEIARQKDADKKPYTWPPDMQEMAAVMDQRLGKKPEEKSTKANIAIEQLSNYSKQMNEEAKRLSTEASQKRQELSALQETMSSILDTVNKAVKRAVQNF